MLSDEKVEVDVIFKKDKGGVFACLVGLTMPQITIYSHVGQHSESTYEYCSKCKPATPEEYADLKEELESLGYVLTVRRRFYRPDYDGEAIHFYPK